MEKEKEKDVFGKKPKYNTLHTNNCFKVPDKYFETFATDIQSYIMHREKEEKELKEALNTGKRSMYEKLKPYLYMAAMFVGLLLMSNIFFSTSSNDKNVSSDVNNELFKLQEDGVKQSAAYIKSHETFKKYLEDQAVEASLVNLYDPQF